MLRHEAAAIAARFTMGFEVEFEWNGTPTRAREAAARLASQGPDAWADDCGYDCSLNDGSEYRSFVRTYAEWRAARPAMQRWFQSVTRGGARAFESRRCGQHVHLGRNGFDAVSLQRVLGLVTEAAKSEFMELSQRRAGWRAAGERVRQRDTAPFNFCTFDLARFAHGGDSAYRVEHFLHTRPGRDSALRTAVSLCDHHPTIEFRLWQGTLGVDGWLLRLGATHAVGHYALLDVADAPLTWDAWVQWVHEPEQAAQYPELVAWLARRAARRAARVSDTSAAPVASAASAASSSSSSSAGANAPAPDAPILMEV